MSMKIKWKEILTDARPKIGVYDASRGGCVSYAFFRSRNVDFLTYVMPYNTLAVDVYMRLK